MRLISKGTPSDMQKRSVKSGIFVYHKLVNIFDICIKNILTF